MLTKTPATINNIKLQKMPHQYITITVKPKPGNRALFLFYFYISVPNQLYETVTEPFASHEVSLWGYGDKLFLLMEKKMEK